MPFHLSLVTTLLLGCLIQLALVPHAQAHPHILKAGSNQEMAIDDLIDDLAGVQVVLIGELHNHVGHHQAQLSIMRALHAREERTLALGVEMFRQDSQSFLDRWTAGQLTMHQFIPVFLDNWSMWDEYRPIFEYVREHSITTVGLNISRDITSKVARNGFASLEEEQKQALGNVLCVVDPAYSSYIRRALGGHGGEGREFLFFCEAQLLWDTMMARTIVQFLQKNLEYRMVVIAGSAHAWKFGIPRQMLDQADLSYRVILPEIPGRISRHNLDPEFADYLWLDEGEDGWDF